MASVGAGPVMKIKVRTAAKGRRAAGLSLSTCRWPRVVKHRPQDNDPGTPTQRGPKVSHYTIAGLLRLRAFCRSGPISLLAAWASHEADHPLTNRYRKAPVVSACHHPLHTAYSVLLSPVLLRTTVSVHYPSHTRM